MPGADQSTLVYVIGRVNQGVRREMRARLSQFELSVPEFTTLSVLRRRPGLSNAQLARRAMIAPQSMIEVLSRLEERGLVQRRTSVEHKRVLRTELTAKGERLLDAAEPHVLDIEDEMLVGVPEGDRRVVLDGLLRAMRRLSDGL